MSSYVKKLEGYTDLDAGIIRSTKINKVLKALIKLNTIPRDEEFNFKSRSIDLLGKMGKLLGASDTDLDAADGGAEKDTEAEPATNGITKEEDAKPAVEAAPAPAVDDAPSAEPATTAAAPPAEPEPTIAATEATIGAEPMAEVEKTHPTIPEPAKVESEEATAAPTTATVASTSAEAPKG